MEPMLPGDLLFQYIRSFTADGQTMIAENPGSYRRLRHYTYQLLHSADIETRTELLVRRGIGVLILLNVVAVMIETISGLPASVRTLLGWVEYGSVAVFSVEYLMRVWSAVEIPRFSRPIAGRIRYCFTFFALVDLAAVLPFYIPRLVTVDLRLLRVLRLFRLVRLVKLGRYSATMAMMGRVIRRKREEMTAAVTIMMLILLTSSTVMFYLENSAQPEAFPNLPAALWWGVATLTTIGYGDVYPVTVAGKICAAVIAILGIGVVALPSGIVVTGLIEEFQEGREPLKCPHCGEDISGSNG